jgi:UDPglucose 6-dehydrogenase
VKAAATSIARHLTGYAVIVNKSTVPVGTGDVVSDIIREHYRGEFDVASNPEFLREGSAISDFMKPDRIVVGNASAKAKTQLEALYAPLHAPLLFTDIKTAELIKYASNAMLATQISFINSIAQICDVVGADVTHVAAGMKLDGRIGQRAFLNAGVGYGGSCFPKDVKALIQIAHDHGVHFEILEAVEDVNAQQRRILIERIRTAVDEDPGREHPAGISSGVAERLPRGGGGGIKEAGANSSLTGTRIALWGLAFKPETDDLREAPAIDVARALIADGATVVAYDPVAGELATKLLSELELAASPLAAANGADALAILTEWDEFRGLDLIELKKTLKHPTVIDGRNVYDLAVAKAAGLQYHSVGRPAVGR